MSCTDATKLLPEIALFRLVAEAGSFAEAARRLELPKSTLTRALDRLEQATHIRLLDRDTRPISITEDGKAFYRQVTPHLAALQDALKALTSRSLEPRGSLRITAPTDLAPFLLASSVIEFTERFPDVHVAVNLENRFADLREGGFDVALRVAAQLSDSSLVARKLFQLEVDLFASPSYLARRPAPRSPGDLSEHHCIGFEPNLRKLKAWKLRSDDRTETVLISPRIIADEFVYLKTVLRAGGGIGTLPSFLAAEDLASGALLRVLPGWSAASAPVYLIHTGGGRKLPTRVRAFCDFMIERFRHSALL